MSMTASTSLSGTGPITCLVDDDGDMLGKSVVLSAPSHSQFVRMSDDDMSVFISWWLAFTHGAMWDGDAVSIDCIDNVFVHLSKTSFYQLISSNYLKERFNAFSKFVRNSVASDSSEHMEYILGMMRRHFDEVSELNTIEKVVNSHILSNALAVSCLARDNDGLYVISRRAGATAIAGGNLSTTVTGGVSWDDDVAKFDGDVTLADLCIHAAVREMKEELGLVIDASCCSPRSLMMGVRRMQPVVTVDVLLPHDVSKLISSAPIADDYGAEISELMPSTEDDIKNALAKMNVTEVEGVYLASVCH